MSPHLTASLFLAVIITFQIMIVVLAFRNQWVFSVRLRWIREARTDRELFHIMEKSASYSTMLWRWWCWDAEKFYNRED